MKNPREVTPIIKGKIYSIPTFMNSYGKVHDGSPTTIKFYTEDSNENNPGVKPVTLIAAIIDFYDREVPVIKEAIALGRLKTALLALERLEDGNN